MRRRGRPSGPATSAARRRFAEDDRGAAVRHSASSPGASFLVTFIASSSPPSSRRSSARVSPSRHRAGLPGRLAALPGRPADVHYKGETYRPLHGPDRRHDRELALIKRAARSASSSTRATRRGRADHLGRLVADAVALVVVRAAVAELRRRLEPHRLSRGCCSTRSLLAVSGRSGPSCRARSSRMASPGSGSPAGRSLHAAARHDLPARRGDAHPDLHAVREAGLGGDLAAAPRPDILRERLRRVPAAAVPDDDPARDGRVGRDRRGRPVPDADLDPRRRPGR